MSRGRLALGAGLILVAVGVAAVYLLGRGRLEEGPIGTRAPGLREEAPLVGIRLYFADPERFSLLPEERSVAVGGDLEERLGSCIRELAAGSLTGSAPVLPPGTRLTRAFLDPWGVAFLDFSREILEAGRAGDGVEWLAVASVVRTLAENFPEIREIRFMVEGHVVTSLGGAIDLEEPLSAEDFPLAGAVR